MTSVDPSIVRFRDLVTAAAAHVDSRKQEINDLNVFPVADGDTGDNMALTLRSVVEELDAVLQEGLTLDQAGGREELVRRLARAARPSCATGRRKSWSGQNFVRLDGGVSVAKIFNAFEPVICPPLPHAIINGLIAEKLIC